MTVRDANYTARAVRARKAHPCDDYHHDGPGIRPGDLYVRSVVFPGHDANTDGPAPWAHRLCSVCAQRYDIPKAVLSA